MDRHHYYSDVSNDWVISAIDYGIVYSATLWCYTWRFCVDKYIGFTITAYNEDNKTSRTFTATNLDDTSTNIIIDKTSPTIVLIGATNVTIPTDSTTYNIANATASDLSYAGDITIGGTSTDFDITTPGNYTFTYKAPNDAAGNLGPSIPRYVEVKNTPPIGITTFTIETNTGYAKAGDTINFYLLVNNTITSHNFDKYIGSS